MTHDMTRDTLRDIIAKYAPEYSDKIDDKYIVEIDYRAHEQYGPCESTIREDWNAFAFDTKKDALEFITQRTAEIRDDVKSYLHPQKDITYSVSLAYKKIPCIIVASDTEIDLDVGNADFTDDSGRVACYCYDDFLNKPEIIEYDNYNFSNEDLLV